MRRQLGKYQLIEQLGSGGMAVVYLAVARGPSGFTKLVVLKVLRDAETSGESEAESEAERQSWVNMFLNEARLAARLNHPNVVQTLEAGEEQGRHLIVMEYLDGRSLQNICDREKELGTRLPLAGRIRILADALAGLHYAHELADFDGSPLGVVHRDVSPHNIFITFDGRVKVLDFGIAKLSVASGFTETGVLKGKVRYMSPEQALGERVDRSTDIFAMGIVLWEALTGRSLWQDKNEMQILQVLLNDDPLPSVQAVNPAVPERLGRACMKALDYRRERRFRTCAEFRAELMACLDELPDQITNEDVGSRISEMFAMLREKHRQAIAKQLAIIEAPQEIAQESAGPVSQQRPKQPGQSRAGVLILLVLLLASGGAYAFWRDSGKTFRADAVPIPSAMPAAIPGEQTVVAPPTPAEPTPSASASAAPSEAPIEAPHPAAGVAPSPPSPKPRNAIRSRSRSKDAATPTSTSSDNPAQPAAVAAPNAAADDSRVHLDTTNPWSSGAPAAEKP